MTGLARRRITLRAMSPAAPVTRVMRLAALTTGALVVGSMALRVVNPYGAPAPDASDWVPHLWAMAAFLLVALAHAWAPTLAWTSLIVAASASALAAVGVVREVRALTGVEPVPSLGVLVAVALVVPPVIAAAYATSDGRRPRLLVAVAWAVSGALCAWLIGSFVTRTLVGQRGGVPEWVWLGVVGGLTAIGLVRDLAPAVVRTRVRLHDGAPAGEDTDEEAGTRRGGGAFTAVRIFVDELVPGREAGRAEAAELERGRLAADLHAEVLPSLRRALAEVERGGTVERLAADLRTAVDDVEALLVSRRSIVLEEMGLLSAIEWLAERTEDRSAVRVGILVEGDGTAGGAASRPPRDVERAAFRVAQLALDNVVRHAPGAAVEVRIAVAPTLVRLRITDDGDGPAINEAAAASMGRRGIADMRAEARACGATVELGRGAGGRGTVVDLSWPG